VELDVQVTREPNTPPLTVFLFDDEESSWPQFWRMVVQNKTCDELRCASTFVEMCARRHVPRRPPCSMCLLVTTRAARMQRQQSSRTRLLHRPRTALKSTRSRTSVAGCLYVWRVVRGEKEPCVCLGASGGGGGVLARTSPGEDKR
jgi:hypothetical protein